MKGLIVILLLVFLFVLPAFMGCWCAHNSELLFGYYAHQGSGLYNVTHFPRWPFIIGAYFTQCALPYGIITEIWCHCVGVK